MARLLIGDARYFDTGIGQSPLSVIGELRIYDDRRLKVARAHPGRSAASRYDVCVRLPARVIRPSGMKRGTCGNVGYGGCTGRPIVSKGELMVAVTIKTPSHRCALHRDIQGLKDNMATDAKTMPV